MAPQVHGKTPLFALALPGLWGTSPSLSRVTDLGFLQYWGARVFLRRAASCITAGYREAPRRKKRIVSDSSLSLLAQWETNAETGAQSNYNHHRGLLLQTQ